MAKQRGIHQISGKINNLCYYEQKFVRGGLIRRINEAMSERLKTDPVFENTRHANAIFGGCSICASALLGFFGSRNTYLFKPYRQALLTTAVKKNLLTFASSSRYPAILDLNKGFEYLPIIFDGIVKNKIRDFFTDIPLRVEGLSIESTYEFLFSFDDLSRFCSKFKCIGVSISISPPLSIYTLSYYEENGRYSEPEKNGSGRGQYYNWYLQDEDESASISVGTGTVDDATTFWIVYVIPILSQYQNRPVFGETGACCGVVTFRAS